MTPGAQSSADGSSESRRKPGSKPSPATPLLNWEAERSIILLEARRTELMRRISLLKIRSYARIIAEAELRNLTQQALRLESGTVEKTRA